jgi:uncharacterized surface protein with fasciclin (FAS1) repeats
VTQLLLLILALRKLNKTIAQTTCSSSIVSFYTINKTKNQKMKFIKNTIFAFAVSLVAVSAMAQDKKDVVDIAIGSADHTTLVAAVKAADLVTTLKGTGPFTVFAPTNAAFAKLPAGTVETLLKPENKAKLAGILTYHVVAGNLDATKVLAAIKGGMGKVVLTTVAGGKLTASIEGGKVILTDEKGAKAIVTATDLKGSNGVIHVIDSVLLPK